MTFPNTFFPTLCHFNFSLIHTNQHLIKYQALYMA